MIRNILMMTTAAGVLSLAATVAAAQDPAVPPPPATTPTLAPQANVFVPGAQVVASDGAALGAVERVHISPTGEQVLHVRTADGTVKAAPTAGASVREDGTVAIAWTEAEFEAEARMPATPLSMPVPTPSEPEA